jgi:hypothetical protein
MMAQQQSIAQLLDLINSARLELAEEVWSCWPAWEIVLLTDEVSSKY